MPGRIGNAVVMTAAGLRTLNCTAIGVMRSKMLETSPQAQFLVPMTLSLSAGLLLGMAASLILTPVCYAILGKA
ncbi:MAG: hypothetical protein EPN17_13280 [Methylobacter sp.]|nr:MAG: hypothetical protein EPN17_13280 [Methylobacter sp.]